MEFSEGRGDEALASALMESARADEEGLSSSALRERVRELEVRLAEVERRERLANERLDWMREIGASMARRRDPNDAIGVLLDRLVRVVGATRGAVYLVEPGGEYIAARTVIGGRLKEIRLAVGEGLAGSCARALKPVNVKDASKDPRWRFAFDDITGDVTVAVLCVPMLDTRGELLGVIQVINREDGGYFSTDDEQMLHAVASSVAVLVENFRYYLEQMNQNMELHEIRLSLEERVRELDVLSRLERTMTEATSPEDEINAIADATLSLVSADGCIISYWSEGDFRRVLYASATGPQVALEEQTPWFETMIEGERPLILDDVRLRLPCGRLSAGAGSSYLGVPLRDNNAIVGGIELVNGRTPREAYGEEHAKVMVLIAGQFARAVGRNRERRQRESEGRIAALGAMLSGVMHDLKTPLSICRGYVQLMTRVGDAQKRSEFASVIERQFNDIREMTQEVIAYARGEVQLYERRCDISLFAAELERSIVTMSEQTSVEASVVVEAQGSLVVDEGKLKRIVTNLGRNALEAMHPQGGRLEVCFRRVGDELEVRVSDTGPGIPPQLVDRIFDAFVSSGKATGSGLGLSIVRRLTLELGGTIAVDSSPMGTSFTLRVPWRAEAVRMELAPS